MKQTDTAKCVAQVRTNSLTATSAVKERDNSEVETQLQELEYAVNRLESAVDDNIARISNVLYPEKEVSEKPGGDPEVIVSPLSEAIRSKHKRVSQIAARLVSVNHRIEC